MFFHVHQLCRIFFLGQVPCTIFFLGGEEGNWRWKCSASCCRNVTLDTRQNQNAWNRLQVRTNIFELSYIQPFCFPVKIIFGENITKYQTRPMAIAQSKAALIFAKLIEAVLVRFPRFSANEFDVSPNFE